MNWTKEQEDAIYKKNSNILVAAAAGSGKTAVLVERIIQKILNDGIDIDKLLVVTFTNAAASEMRERVLEAIYRKIDEEPENKELQKQVILLGKADICTIHSFCLEVIKNNFSEIDLSANFRIGTEEEIELLKQEVIEDVFEELYESEDENFAKLVNTYTGYRGDEALKDIVLKIYRFMQSAPFPNEWLMEKINAFKADEKNKDFSKSIWGEVLIESLKEEIIDGINSLKIIQSKIEKYIELEKYYLTIVSDIEILETLYEKTEISWDEAYKFVNEIKFKSWPVDRKITLDAKDEAKKARDTVKNKLMKNAKETLVYDSKNAYNDIYKMYEILKILKEVILEFDKKFKLKKRERNIIDFNDIEHYALKILVKKDKNGNYVPTEVAKKYQEKFEEIAIDEYQDSNEVQEYILKTVSRGNNLFMVGDVKQSIYKFRQACPELFLDKYENYSLDGNEKGLKIQLFKNFRSRKNVLDITNTVFKNIMSRKLGDIEYNETEFLNLGADFDETKKDILGKAELNIIELKEDYDEEEQDEILKENKYIEKEEVEAKLVANKIEEIISSKVKVKDKKIGYREVTFKDIVILLRATSKVAPIYERELLKRGIPVYSDASNEYLDTIEIQTIINVLKILDNPIDDISLVSVLRSEIGGFTDNELLKIRLCSKDTSFYESLKAAKNNLEGPIKEKLDDFIEKTENWREETDYLSLAELIWKIYTDTNFYNYVGLMPNGTIRQANLKMLFERAKEYEKTSFKGLFNFIKFVEKLRSGNSDMTAAKVIGENENVVRIMSIHKSKGLEFPIVILSGTSKKINLQDLNSNILLHQKMGIGPQYIDYEKMIEYSTSAKDAIKIIIKEETISEEMRILYVALTRAKEKLIITGTVKEYQKDLEKKQELLNVYNSENEKINPILLKKYISYLDWIELVILSSNLSNLIEVKKYSKNEILSLKSEARKEEIRKFDFDKKIDIDKIRKVFNWQYKEKIATMLPIKSTVSKIKEMKQESFIESELDLENINNKEIGIESLTPSFMQEEKMISASKKGTLMHLFMQKINFKENYNLEKLEELKQELIEKNIFTYEESKHINLNKVVNFTKSNIFEKIKNCSNIEKEKAFCKKILAREIYEEADNQTILVQGIIDLYAIKINGEIILVDYKTDFVKDGNEESLVNKYLNQLKIYKEALEEALDKKVSEVYIYSLYLDKEIEVKI